MVQADIVSACDPTQRMSDEGKENGGWEQAWMGSHIDRAQGTRETGGWASMSRLPHQQRQ